jgi:predicted deacylase
LALKIGNVHSVPGEKTKGFVHVLTMADGGDLRLPVHIVTGTKPGPTLCLTAALHGDESDSIIAVMDVVKKTDPTQLAGTIIAAPVCNPPSFEACTYNTPMDGMHLDFHAFPGDDHGTISQQIAHALVSEIVSKEWVDVLIDVHATPRSFSVEMNYLYISPGSEANRELALVQGYAVNYLGPEGATAGSLTSYATELGIPNSYSNGRVRDIENVMKQYGMIEGEPVLPDKQFITQPPRTELRPKNGGIVFPEFSLEEYPDQIVPAGTVLGRLVSPYTFEQLEEFVAPWEAAVSLWCVDQRRFNPGAFAYILGKMDDVEWVRR